MSYKKCKSCNIPVESTGDFDYQRERSEKNYECPKCNDLYIHRREYNQNGLITSDTFEAADNNPKKEDEVREALGVEKRFIVNIDIATIGTMQLKQIMVNAVNESGAAVKAKELALSGEVDAAGYRPEEESHDYDYADSNTWTVEVNEDKK